MPMAIARHASSIATPPETLRVTKRQRINIGEAEHETRRHHALLANPFAHVVHAVQHHLEQQRHFDGTAKLQWISQRRWLDFRASQ
jgi:hypothetical protein